MAPSTSRAELAGERGRVGLTVIANAPNPGAELAGERGRVGSGELSAEAGEEIEAGLFEGDRGLVGQVFFSSIPLRLS
jgi:hypothetical protein